LIQIGKQLCDDEISKCKTRTLVYASTVTVIIGRYPQVPLLQKGYGNSTICGYTSYI